MPKVFSDPLHTWESMMVKRGNRKKWLFSGFFLLFSFLYNKASHSPGWPQTHSVAKGDLEHLIFLPQPSKCWDYECVPPHLVYAESGSHLKALCILGEHSIN